MFVSVGVVCRQRELCLGLLSHRTDFTCNPHALAKQITPRLHAAQVERAGGRTFQHFEPLGAFQHHQGLMGELGDGFPLAVCVESTECWAQVGARDVGELAAKCVSTDSNVIGCCVLEQAGDPSVNARALLFGHGPVGHLEDHVVREAVAVPAPRYEPCVHPVEQRDHVVGLASESGGDQARIERGIDASRDVENRS